MAISSQGKSMVASVLLAALSTFAADAQLSITQGNSVAITNSGFDAKEFSGITYDEERGIYYAVGDSVTDKFFQLDVVLNTDGTVQSATVTGTINVDNVPSADWEGIAYNKNRNSVFVSNENDHSITEYSISGGGPIGSINIPEIYKNGNTRGNLSFESLTYGAGSYWTCNEEALQSDGPISTTQNGTVIRIQRFDEQFNAIGQWAYETDAITGIAPSYHPISGKETCGVSDMLMLETGQLLVLERELGYKNSVLGPFYRNRIYLIDFTGATDVSGIASLADMTGISTVSKQLLWEGLFTLDNYEGLCLGPRLENGDYAILLVSDNAGGSNSHNILSLTLGGYNRMIPEPSASLMLAASAAGLFLYRRRRK